MIRFILNTRHLKRYLFSLFSATYADRIDCSYSGFDSDRLCGSNHFRLSMCRHEMLYDDHRRSTVWPIVRIFLCPRPSREAGETIPVRVSSPGDSGSKFLAAKTSVDDAFFCLPFSQFFTVIASESIAFLPVMPSSPAKTPRYSPLSA